MKVALYCRVSTHDQSCSRQEQDLIDYANRAKYDVVGIWKETASGFSSKLLERGKVIALAQSRKIDAILVTELSRWGRSTIDLIHTLNDLSSWNVSLIAVTGMQFDLHTPHGKMIATIMSSIAEFERDLIRERVCSGLASAKARGKILGRRPGQRPKSDRLAPKVLKMLEEGYSYRHIAFHLRLSKTTVVEIVKRHRQSQT